MGENKKIEINFEFTPLFFLEGNENNFVDIISDCCKKIVNFHYSERFSRKLNIALMELVDNGVKYSSDKEKNIKIKLSIIEDICFLEVSNSIKEEDYLKLKDYLDSILDPKFLDINFIKVLRQQRNEYRTGGLGLMRLLKEDACIGFAVKYLDGMCTLMSEIEVE